MKKVYILISVLLWGVISSSCSTESNKNDLTPDIDSNTLLDSTIKNSTQLLDSYQNAEKSIESAKRLMDSIKKTSTGIGEDNLSFDKLSESDIDPNSIILK